MSTSTTTTTSESSQALIWGTATVMVTIVSCCSLIGVSIMPLISGPSYKIFITLFTGLAVGSLLGSSIFSLIPQAFSLHLKQDKDYLWKSLVIFCGIYLFYFSERLMRIHFDRKARQLEKLNNQQQQMQLTTTASSTSSQSSKKQTSKSINNNNSNSGDSKLKPDSNIKQVSNRGDFNDQDEPLHSTRSNKDPMMDISLSNKDNQDEIQIHQHNAHHHHHHHHHHHQSVDTQQVLTKALKGESQSGNKNILAKQNGIIAPVAWMIIIGDGLHNFIDGLTIGAAFSQSISLGINTSIAVIFEEFPHELGDFAVLISSGMTVRQALGFNFLSACTCYIGMIFGVILGDMTQSASYIFALAGGMFLYISLVDMMGELSAMLEESKSSTKETTRLLIMQNIGILSGIIIIFILSLYSQ